MFTSRRHYYGRFRIVHIDWANTFALASALLHTQRFTTFTTSRIARCWPCAYRDDFSRRAPRLYSTPTKRSFEKGDGEEKQKKSALSSLLDLVPEARTRKEGSRREGRLEPGEEQQQPEALFVPRIKKNIHETPTDRWRFRKQLGGRSRVGGEDRDESVASSPDDTNKDKNKLRSLETRPSTGGEINWQTKHLALLRPPYQDRAHHRTYRQHAYIRKGMRNWAQILTTPTADTPGTTLLLHFDNKRYLVGSLAEGTQRACVQMGARLLKVQECFLTGRTEWKNTGGLIGMILTLADAVHSSRESSIEDAVGRAKGKAKRLGLELDGREWRELVEEAKTAVPDARLTVFGPRNLNHAMATARRFVFRKGMPVDLHEVRDLRASGGVREAEEVSTEGEDQWAPYWADENIKVWPMAISPAPSTSSRPATSNGVGTVSPQKRSIDEVYLDERAKTTAPNGTLQTPATDPSLVSQADKDALTAKAVVSEMFNSSWRLDTLYETHLSQVNLPASIFIRNPETKKVEKYRGPLPGSGKEIPDPDMTVLVRKPWPGALVESLPPTQPSEQAISYIIKNHIQRGRFFPEKAKELKVEKGLKWSLLQKGESVENVDGEKITPEMVLGESKEGGGIAVVDLPDERYVEPLLARPEWRETKVMDGVGAIMWTFGQRGVATDERVLAFIREFGGLKHIVASPEHSPNGISLDSTAAATVRLGKIDPGRYGVPIHENKVAGEAKLPEKAVVAQRGLIVQTEPKMELQTNQVVPLLSIPEVESEMSSEVLEEANKAQQALQDSANDPAIAAWKSSLPNPDADITTLGTGSALPSKYRNVSATLVRVPGWGNILLDAGENTLGQLKRVFPPTELAQMLQDLRILFISHMHADHHLGTVGVLKAWYSEVHSCQPLPPPPETQRVQDLLAPGQAKRLTVISEPAMQHWLTEYAAIEDFGLSRITPLVISAAKLWRNEPSKLSWFVPPSQLNNNNNPTTSAVAEYSDRIASTTIPSSLIGLQDAQAVLVQHCHGARAVSLTLPSGFKISYSGDCRPSKAFAQIGKGSTVCIHEATFDDELIGDAQAKNHSTTSEALGVALGMRAKACVLTHFSQRYQKMPVLERARGDVGGAGAGERAGEVDESVFKDDAVGEEEEEDAEMAGNDDVAQTFPDQVTTNGTSTSASTTSFTSTTTHPPTGKPPAAVQPIHLPSAATVDMKIAVAFDYMRVRLDELWQMEKFTPALVKLFEEEEGKSAAKSAVASKEGMGRKEKKRGEGNGKKGRGGG